jgi:hypothetical protein
MYDDAASGRRTTFHPAHNINERSRLKDTQMDRHAASERMRSLIFTPRCAV